MICPNCKKENPDHAKFCKYCGANLSVQEEPVTQEAKKKSILPIVLCVLLVILLVAAVFLGYSYVTKSFLFSDAEKTEQSTEKKDSGETDITIMNESEEGTTEEVSGNSDVSIVTIEGEEGTEDEVLKIAQQYRRDAVSYNGHAYAIFNYKEENLSSFMGCEQFCEEMGGHLAVIDSAEENEFLYNYVQDSGLTLAFFGYTDQDAEGHWSWVNGSGSSYTNWASGQPNNGSKNKNAGAENYAEFFKDTADGTWNDAIFGKNTYRFICEWE